MNFANNNVYKDLMDRMICKKDNLYKDATKKYYYEDGTRVTEWKNLLLIRKNLLGYTDLGIFCW